MSVASPSSEHPGSSPLGIGQIISDAFGVSLRNYGWSLLLQLAVFAIFFGLLGSFFWSALYGDQLAVESAIARSIGIFYLLLLAACFLSLAFYCALIRLIHDRHVDPAKPVLAACIAGAKRFLPALGLLLIYLLAYIALYLVAALLGLVFFGIGAPPGFVIVAMLIAGIFALYLVFPYLLSFVICINEDVGPIRALGRSRYLSAGYRWPLFGMMLLTWVIWFAYLLVVNVLARIFGPGGGIAALIMMLLVLPLMYAWLIGVYSIAAYRLRVLKDGVDLTGSVAGVFD